jgi:RNA polymerase sigma factor (sigma-70 family)
MSSQDATVFVVDDDPSVRRSLSRLVKSAGYEVKTFASPTKFLDEQLPQSATCVLLDMCMDGDLNGLDVQRALRQKDRKPPILFLSGHGTVSSATEGMKAGAEDFFEKPFRPMDLLTAIGRAIDRDRSSSNERKEQDALRQRYDTLTPREQQVMKLVVTGLLNKQVAAELGISEKTVKVHRARVMEKMQVESLAALVRSAQRLGILSPNIDATGLGQHG